jgi:hypothetical protein
LVTTCNTAFKIITGSSGKNYKTNSFPYDTDRTEKENIRGDRQQGDLMSLIIKTAGRAGALSKLAAR